MDETSIDVAASGTVALVRVDGRATHMNSRRVRDFAVRALREGMTEFRFELAGCESMDSTFIGVLAWVAMKGRPDGVRVELAHVCERVTKSLTQLGVLKLLDVDHNTASAEAEWAPLKEPEPPGGPADAHRRTILEAHDTLGEVDPANIERFKDVVELMGKEPGE